jgi:hypothetical protein
MLLNFVVVTFISLHREPNSEKLHDFCTVKNTPTIIFIQLFLNRVFEQLFVERSSKVFSEFLANISCLEILTLVLIQKYLDHQKDDEVYACVLLLTLFVDAKLSQQQQQQQKCQDGINFANSKLFQ